MIKGNKMIYQPRTNAPRREKRPLPCSKKNRWPIRLSGFDSSLKVELQHVFVAFNSLVNGHPLMHNPIEHLHKPGGVFMLKNIAANG